MRSFSTIVAALSIAAISSFALAGQDSNAGRAGAQEAPAPAAVLAAAIEAMGGADAFAALESHSFVGRQVKQGGKQELVYELTYVHPDKVHGLHQSQIGPVIMARSGDVGWIKAGVMKTMAADRNQLAPIEEMVKFPRFVYDLERDFEIAPSVEVIEIEGRRAHRLALRRRDALRADGPRPHTLDIDAETGRVLAFTKSLSRPSGATVTIAFHDWAPQGDLVLFTRATWVDRGGPVELRIESFKANEVDESIFAVPDEIAKGASGG